MHCMIDVYAFNGRTSFCQSYLPTATPFRMPLGICDILLKIFFLSSHNHRLILFLQPFEHPYIQIRIPYFDISDNNLAFPSLEPFPVLLHYNSHNSNQNIFSSRSKRRSVIGLAIVFFLGIGDLITRLSEPSIRQGSSFTMEAAT